MKKKPEKIKGVRYDRGSNSRGYQEGYNQAIEEYDKYIADKLNGLADLLQEISGEVANEEEVFIEIPLWETIHRIKKHIRSNDLKGE